MNATESATPAVPDHELLLRVGRGSYGEVWLARGVTGAYRAVKVVHRQSFTSDRPYEREFNGILRYEPVSRSHPGLVSVLHVGRNAEAGYFYYVMEVADDVVGGRQIEPAKYVAKTLGARLRDGPLPMAECIRVGLALSEALVCLHAAQLVHRDLKPSNIIFVEGHPKLADIGLVTGIGEQGTFVGTEGYIPPEGPGTPEADLYGLGKVLYEVSTGKPCDEFPELPGHFRQRADAALFAQFNAVVLKACDNRVVHRFGTAREMHEALAALGGEQSGAALDSGVVDPSGNAGRERSVVVVFQAGAIEAVRLANVLEERLARAGWHVVLDGASEFGVSWARRYESEVEQAQAVLILVSESAVADVAFGYQVDVAVRSARLRGGGPGFLPIRVGYDGPLPGALRLHRADWAALSCRGEGEEDCLVAEVMQRLQAAITPADEPAVR